MLLVCLMGCAWQAVHASPASVRLNPGPASVAVFDFMEFTLTVDKPDAGNPFTDVAVSAEVAPPTGPAVKVDGFCDAEDGSVFRVRFMPRVPGRHAVAITYTQGTFTHAQAAGFTAKAGKLDGPVRVDPAHPFHFIREGTDKHWFWNGTTTYQLLAWDDATIDASLERLAGLGVNRLRVALAGRTKDGTRWNEPLVKPTERFAFKMEPWVAARPDNREDPGFDLTRFNVAFFQKTERLLRRARELNLIISLVFYVDGADKGVDPFGKANMGGPDEQRYYRYAVARIAPFANIMWDVTNEYHLFRDEGWVNRMGAFIKECDPYDHLTSVHGHGKFPFRGAPWADFAMFQSWDEHGGYHFMLNNRREQQNTAGRPMPQINEEYGYEDHYPYPWGQARLWPARTADTRRRLAWEITMAGCYQTTGERANTGTGAGLDTGGGWINGRGDATMTLLVGYGHLRRFFEGFEWWKLEPRPDLLRLPPEPKRAAPANRSDAAPPLPVLHGKPLCLAEPGRRYVIYLPQGGTVTADLAPGRYQARWFNPRSGEWLKKAIPANGGEWTSPVATDAEDWTLLIESKP